MTLTKYREISCFRKAKKSLYSLVIQTVIVFSVFLIIGLFTGGYSSAGIVVVSFIVGIAFVVWDENRRYIAEIRDGVIQKIKEEQIEDWDLRDFTLRDADLRGAHLRGAHLRDAHLRDADLRGAHLRGAHLRDAHLSGADLSGADLRDADLRDANLSRANLSRAEVRKAIFFESFGISEDLRKDLIVRGAIFGDSLGDLL